VIVRVPDLNEEVRHVEFLEPAAELNAPIEASPGWNDPRFVRDVAVVGEVYRMGLDVHFAGHVEGELAVVCGRCLEEFPWKLERSFRFVIVPEPEGADADEDEGLGHYRGEELDLGPLAREQAMLAFEPAWLCSESCRGLCAGCGANLNNEDCRCQSRQ